jgi:hypothetical protein
LVVGYLWLLIAWLVMGDLLMQVDMRSSRRSLKALLGMVDYAGPPLLLGVVSFAAYLVGSLLSYNWGVTRRAKQLLNRHLYRRTLAPPVLLDRDLPLEARLELRTFVDRSIRNLARDSEGIAFSDFADALGSPSQSARALSPSDILATLQQAIVSERDALATRLQIKQENLFQTYDRVRAEAELRLALFLPLVVLGCTLGTTELSGVGLALVLVAFALGYQGILRAQNAEAVLLQALTQDVITSPVLDRLKDSASWRNVSAQEPAADDDPSVASTHREADLVVQPSGDWKGQAD